MKTYYYYGTVTTLNDGDYIPVAPATPGTYKKILWSSIKSLIYSIIYPVGSYYVQYPAASSNDADTAFPTAYSPASLFGGTWELMYSTEGIVFQTEGYDGAGRTNGLMEDQFQGWQLGATADNFGARNYWGRAANRDTTYLGTALSNESIAGITTTGQGVSNMLKAVSDGTNDTPRTGTRTAHRNRLMRVYRRTA